MAVDFEHKIADGFMTKVNPAQIVYPSNNAIKSFVVYTTWAG